MALETKTVIIGGVEYVTNTSTEGKLLEGGFPHGYYEDATDPVSEERSFTETDLTFPDEEYPQWERGIIYHRGDKVTHNLRRYVSLLKNNGFEPREGVLAWRRV